MTTKKYLVLLGFGLFGFSAPLNLYATQTTTFTGLLTTVQGIFDKVIPFIIGLAVFVIIWGIFNYLVHAAEEEKRAEAKKYIIWGIVGVFFMLSIWGFVNILVGTFNLKRTIDTADIPQVPKIGGTTGNNDPGNNNNPGNNDPGFTGTGF